MRKSNNEHVIALVRNVIGFTQKDFADLAGCSTRTIQAIELGSLDLSRKLATKISIETGMSVECLLQNDVDKPLLNTWRRPFTKLHFENINAVHQQPLTGDLIERLPDSLLAAYANLRSIFAVASRQGETAWLKAFSYLVQAINELRHEVDSSKRERALYAGHPLTPSQLWLIEHDLHMARIHFETTPGQKFKLRAPPTEESIAKYMAFRRRNELPRSRARGTATSKNGTGR